ncbi:hypothetical protein Tco_0132105 [Tanacetum coccineum]
MHFLLSSMSVVYVLTTPILEDGGNDATVEQITKRNKWDNDDYVCRGLILKEARYMAEDASSKKFLVSNFTNYKMTDSLYRPVMEQYNKLFGILKDFKHTLKYKKEELTLVELGSHLRIEESLKVQDNDKPKGSNVAGPAVVRLPDPKLKTLGERGIECIFVGYDEHSKAFRSYVIDPNDSVSFNSIIESRDVIFDENRFSSVSRPSLRSLVNRTEDIGGSVVPEEVTEEVSDQHSYCFNVKDEPKTFDEAMKSQDVALWKEAINDEMDSIIGNNTLVLADLPPVCKPLGCKWIFKRKLKVDLTKEFLSLRFSMKDMGEADVILGIRIKHESNGIAISQSHYIENAVSQLEYSRVIGCLMYAMTCTRTDIAFVVGKLSRYTSNPGTQHWQAIQWISNTKDNSSTSGWVFLLGGGAISWASKKQTCITGSTIESEFVALASAGKEAEWLKNLLLEIPLCSKPIAPNYIRCDSAATLAKAYSQMYNRKSKHLGVRHNMIRELIMNEVTFIEFVWSQQNLANHLTKGLARDLVIKSAEGMGLKSN